jgi:hypothetical protein
MSKKSNTEQNTNQTINTPASPTSENNLANGQEKAQNSSLASQLSSSASSPVAKATTQVTNVAQAYGLAPLRDTELRSIYALFAWVANQQNSSEQTVRCITETHFGVEDVQILPQKSYEEVIRFLVDLNLDEVLN